MRLYRDGAKGLLQWQRRFERWSQNMNNKSVLGWHILRGTTTQPKWQHIWAKKTRKDTGDGFRHRNKVGLTLNVAQTGRIEPKNKVEMSIAWSVSILEMKQWSFYLICLRKKTLFGFVHQEFKSGKGCCDGGPTDVGKLEVHTLYKGSSLPRCIWSSDSWRENQREEPRVW